MAGRTRWHHAVSITREIASVQDGCPEIRPTGNGVLEHGHDGPMSGGTGTDPSVPFVLLAGRLTGRLRRGRAAAGWPLLTPLILTLVRRSYACEQSVHARMSRTTSPGAMASGRPPVS